MWNKSFVVSVSLAAAVLCGAAAAAPKPAPQPWLRQGPARNLPRTRSVRDSMPNMTQIPKCYLVAGLRADGSGTIFTDTSGKAIGRMGRPILRLVWPDGRPTQSAPSR